MVWETKNFFTTNENEDDGDDEKEEEEEEEEEEVELTETAIMTPSTTLSRPSPRPHLSSNFSKERVVQVRDSEFNLPSVQEDRSSSFGEETMVFLEEVEDHSNVNTIDLEHGSGHSTSSESSGLHRSKKKSSLVAVAVAGPEQKRLALLRWVVAGAFLVAFGVSAALAVLHETFATSKGHWVWVGIVGIWLLPLVSVAAYDWSMRAAVAKLEKTAKKNKAIVHSLFPANVRDRMLQIQKQSRRFDRRTGGRSPQTRRGHRRHTRERHPHGLQRKPSNADLIKSSIRSLDSNGSFVLEVEGEHDLIPKELLDVKPIADYFPHCTVLFADIAGFTAWSSVRDPTDVFILLESLYSHFDAIAHKLNVFKVETIGDCYMAVTGLPEPLTDHALIMAQFAHQAMEKMRQVVQALAVHLGPDTTDLAMRVGLHSGPVTAGVMRGEKARFQLFGDTVNTASRMESTGIREKIQLSESTATLIREAGYQHWIIPREDLVTAKGKGRLQTYWLDATSPNLPSGPQNCIHLQKQASVTLSPLSPSDVSDDADEKVEEPMASPLPCGAGLKAIEPTRLFERNHFETADTHHPMDERTRWQAEYTAELLGKILKKIVIKRKPEATKNASLWALSGKASAHLSTLEAKLAHSNHNLLEEVVETLEVVLPESSGPHHRSRGSGSMDPLDVKVPQDIHDELLDFVKTISSQYGDHQFHCFEHANHVALSLTKLYCRLATHQTDSGRKSTGTGFFGNPKTGSCNHPKSYDMSFGMAHDPLIEFALVFAALIHDIHHSGRPSSELIQEKHPLVEKYGTISPSELHSIELAWEIFLRPAYTKVRRCIYSTPHELERFRQLVVHLVLATDVLEETKAQKRRKSWETTFFDAPIGTTHDNSPSKMTRRSNQQQQGETASNTNINIANLKSTLVLEAMMQVATVAHCAQHWHVYVKWNRRLFQEHQIAFHSGHARKEPSEDWYDGELTFFDEVVIPLATRIKESGFFGDDAEEFLNYAISNRTEWKAKGKEMISAYQNGSEE